jgi:hypothetical protein
MTTRMGSVGADPAADRRALPLKDTQLAVKRVTGEDGATRRRGTVSRRKVNQGGSDRPGE